ncbi:MAG: phage regulatory CII family protein [Novosphingobium sp.]
MTPALARLKRATIAAVDRCGGVDGAGATAERSRSTAGDWRNLNQPTFPPADCALALDQAVVAQGFAPPITSAMARELGGVFTPLPGSSADAASLHAMLAAHCRESGEVQAELAEALSDLRVGRREAGDVLAPAERLLAVTAAMIAELRAIGADDQKG